jgi:hypothetical protein
MLVMLVIVAARVTCSSIALLTMMRDATQTLAAQLAQLMLSIHAWRDSTNEYLRGICTSTESTRRSID